ncbi:flippase [bacterium]|nr:flippase [bacterium]RQV93730.1 MAG: flippase [bacterium]
MIKKGFTSSSILVKNTLFNFSGMLLPLLVGVIAIPLTVRGLGTEGFGILSIAWIILGYLTLLDFGLSRATTKFAAENLNKNNLNGIPSIFWTSILMGFCFGCLGSVILYLATPHLINSFFKIPTTYLNETRQSFYLLACVLPFLLVSISLKGMLGAAQRFDLVNAVYVPVSTLNFIFPALSMPFGLNLPAIILLIVVSRLIATGVYFFLCLKIYPNCKHKPHMDLPLLKKLLSYGGWITISGVVSPLLVYLDRLFIGSMLSVGLLTYYSAPLEAITRLRIIPQAIMTTLFPEFSKGLNIEDRKRICFLFGKSVKILLLTTGIISLILSFNAHDILNLWLGKTFAEQSTSLFQIFSVSILINFLALVPFTYLQGIGRPDLPAKFHLIELPIYLFLLWVSITTFGILGAAYAWLFRVTLDFVLLYRWSFKFLPKLSEEIRSIDIRKILTLLLLFGLILIPIRLMVAHLIIRIILLSGLIILLGWAIWLLILDTSEKAFIKSTSEKLCFLKWIHETTH